MGKKVDLTGQRFGMLVAIKDVGIKNRSVLWECECDCGSHVEVMSKDLKSGNTKSCGCMRIRDLSGQTFGKLVVINPTNKRSNGSVLWKCKCDCGKYTNVTSGNLLSGSSESCGCSRIENLEGNRYGKLIVIQKTAKRSNGYVLWKCKCDCGRYAEVISRHLKSGNTKSCGCLKLEMVGDKNPHYNANLTYEERIKNRYELGGGSSVRWSKQVMERDNYTCQVCGDNKGGNLNSHHLNGWNAFPEQRFDLDNGVTLCTDCHKEFHSQYGYGDNTREQFDEYAASKTLVLN